MKLAINANVFTVIILLLCGFIGFFWRNHWAALVFDHLDWFAADVQKIHAHQPVPLRKGEPLILPEYFSTEGKLQSTKLFLSETGLLGLVVLNNGQLVYERYKPGKNHRDLFYSWSMAKSITSVLVGFAIEEGYIHSVKDPVSVYLPEFSDHLFGQASVEDLLTMSSGVDFNENYSDPKSDVLQLFLSIKNDQSSFLKTLSRQPLNSLNEPFLAGQYNQYVSSDTQVLTMILQRVLPMPISKYLELKLWKPAGMESPAYWLADKTGMVAGFCCLKTSTRDMARLGQIMLQRGIYQGTPIIPANWINQSLDTTPIRLQAGKQPWSRSTWAYGYQWWMPPSIDKTNQMLMNDFLAVGVFYQFLFISPKHNIVITRHSAAPDYLFNNQGMRHIDFFNRIITQINASWRALTSPDGQCLSVNKESTGDARPITLAKCDGSIRQSWWVNKGLLHSRNGGCAIARNNTDLEHKEPFKAHQAILHHYVLGACDRPKALSGSQLIDEWQLKGS